MLAGASAGTAPGIAVLATAFRSLLQAPILPKILDKIWKMNKHLKSYRTPDT